MDELEEAHTVIAELRLNLILLENERNALKQENNRLKDNLQQLIMQECLHSGDSATSNKKRELSHVAKERWAYYHQHKKTVEHVTHWWDVKKETDRMYYRSK
jgi:septal ring factor EnvC (AmiA/AmiB activator)